MRGTLILLIGLAVVNVGASDHPGSAIQAEALKYLGALPEKMPGAEKDTPELVSLGERLFHEKRLSVNGTQSCSSCHRIDARMGGVDNEATSPGAFGKRGGRNSPTVLNAGFQLAQFWDGRAASLEHQAKGPILNPIEMAMASEAEAVKRLHADQEYAALFKKAFQGTNDPVTYDNVATAIAAFERTLITRDRFDDFQKGKLDALSSSEIAGLKTFIEVGCAACHSGPVLGGNTYQKVGLIHPYQTTDVGRAEVTGDENDTHKFKVPMLRNIALTGPYFHDGKIVSLEEAVRKMGWHQIGKHLTDEEVTQIVNFLNSLTDKSRVEEKPRASQ